MELTITSDATLKGPVWAATIDRLVGTVFKTNWELYSLCISIGLMYDCQIESNDMVPENYVAEPRSVPRTVMLQSQNFALLKVMLQTAFITTKHLNYNEDKRLELAFNKESIIDFNPISFLTNFANYGIEKISNAIADTEGIETLVILMNFLNSTYEDGVNVIDDEIDIDEIYE